MRLAFGVQGRSQAGEERARSRKEGARASAQQSSSSSISNNNKASQLGAAMEHQRPKRGMPSGHERNVIRSVVEPGVLRQLRPKRGKAGSRGKGGG